MRASIRRGTRRRRVLLTAQSSATLLWTRLLLQETGADLLVTRDGDAALAVATAEQPDLILLDSHLPSPGASGLETCRRLRAVPALRDTPIVLMIRDDDERGDCFDSGSSDVLTKPFDRAIFRRMVHRWLAAGGRTAPPPPLAATTTVGPLPRADRSLRPLLRVVRSRNKPHRRHAPLLHRAR